MAYRTTYWKNTDIGKIPNDWSVVPLSSICDNYTGLTYSPSDVSNSGTLVLRSSNIQNDRLSFLDNVFVKMSIPERAMARNGDLLVCVRNGSPKLIGKSAIVTGDNMAFGAFMTVLRAKNFSAKYLPFIWRSSYIQKQVQITLGATINQITNGDIRKFFVPISQNVEEQQKIAAVLTDLDDLIAELENVRDKKRAIKIGAMQELLTGKHRLNGFTEPWKEVKLGNVADVLKGANLSKGKTSLNGHNSCILYGELFTTYKEKILNVVSRTDYDEGVLSKKGDVLLPGSTTTTGIDLAKASALMLDNILLGGDINILRVDFALIDSVFLAYLITHTQRNAIDKIAKGTTVYHLHGTDLKDLAICIPTDKSEQTAIANVLSDMDNEISAINDKINKYKQIKAGVADELLSGRIRLIKPQE